MNGAQTIVCKYSCKACRLVNIEVTVPARNQEDVVKFVEDTAFLMGADHMTRSPSCLSMKIDLMIPLPAGSDKIGEVSLQ